MVRSVVNFNSEAIRGGKAAATKYCQEWQMEITAASAKLTAELATKRIDAVAYNERRAALNKQTQELNSCVQSLNKKFGS